MSITPGKQYFPTLNPRAREIVANFAEDFREIGNAEDRRLADALEVLLNLNDAISKLNRQTP